MAGSRMPSRNSCSRSRSLQFHVHCGQLTWNLWITSCELGRRPTHAQRIQCDVSLAGGEADRAKGPSLQRLDIDFGSLRHACCHLSLTPARVELLSNLK
jgi:hypothetical protein